jgi:hypothetical protein
MMIVEKMLPRALGRKLAVVSIERMPRWSRSSITAPIEPRSR